MARQICILTEPLDGNRVVVQHFVKVEAALNQAPFVDTAGKTFQGLAHTGGAVIVSNGTRAQLNVLPVSVDKGAVVDLGGAKNVPPGTLPVFVTVTYTNAGTTKLQFPSLGTYLLATETSGGQALPFPTDNPVAKCVSHDSPEEFAPGASFTDCQVFLVHKGNTVSKIVYRPGDVAKQTTWKIGK